MIYNKPINLTGLVLQSTITMFYSHHVTPPMILHIRSIPALIQLTLDWVRLVKSGANVACLQTSLACYSQTPSPPLATAHKGRYSGQKLVWKTDCIQRRNQKANVEYPEYHGDREHTAAVNKRITSESLQRMREHWCNKLMYTYSDCNICTSCVAMKTKYTGLCLK